MAHEYKVPFQLKSTRLLAQKLYIFDRLKFSWFFSVVFGCSFLDKALHFLFLSKSYDFFCLKPQAFLLNVTLPNKIVVVIYTNVTSQNIFSLRLSILNVEL